MKNNQKKIKDMQPKGYPTNRILWLSRAERISLNLILKIVGILVVVVGIGILISQGNTAKNELKQYQALQVFLKMDDFAHIQINDMMATTGKAYGFTWIDEFEKLDNKFHTSNIFEERFKYIEEMDTFLGDLNWYLNKTIGINTPEDWIRNQTYNKAHNMFLQTKSTLFPNK